MESRDSRLATLVADKQRLSEEAEQRQREVRFPFLSQQCFGAHGLDVTSAAIAPMWCTSSGKHGSFPGSWDA